MRAPSRDPHENAPLRFMIYRCVYCRCRIADRLKLATHEAACVARVVIEQHWRDKIAQARIREAHGT